MEPKKLINIDTPKTFIVISSPKEDLAVGLAIALTQSKQQLQDKFNGKRLPPWPAMVNHLPGDSHKEEIIASLEDVLEDDKNFMMILSGYENTESWNAALTEFMSSHNLSATFLNFQGVTLSNDLSKLFHVNTDLGHDPENALNRAWNAIRDARERSSVPIAKTGLGTTPMLH